MSEAKIQGARRGKGPTKRASFPSLIARVLRTPPRRPISSLALTTLLSWALLPSSILLPGQSKPSEYSVKAAYLLNFGKFMRLSPGAKFNANDFNICVVGDNPFDGSLYQITAGEQIDGRPVRVVLLEKTDLDKPELEKPAFGNPDSRQCAIAYFSISEEKRMDQDLAAFRDSDTLTVSDAPDFLKRGGMIQLLLVSNHVRFSVNLDPVRRTHLSLSSELLRVAASVSGNRTGEVLP